MLPLVIVACFVGMLAVDVLMLAWVAWTLLGKRKGGVA